MVLHGNSVMAPGTEVELTGDHWVKVIQDTGNVSIGTVIIGNTVPGFDVIVRTRGSEVQTFVADGDVMAAGIVCLSSYDGTEVTHGPLNPIGVALTSATDTNPVEVLIMPLGQPHPNNDKLMRVSNGQYENTFEDIEYYSPNQHGGRYGTVYRMYFGSSLPSYLTSGNNVNEMVDSRIYFYNTVSGRAIIHTRGYSAAGAHGISLGLSGTSGDGNLVLTISGDYVVRYGWVDYTEE